MSENIPMDIQVEILKRLPLKPLIQFRSVSKSFKRLIDSPDFVVSYGVRPPPENRFILRYEDYPLFVKEVKYLCLVDNNVDGSFVQQEFIIPTVPSNLINIVNVVGSSHGLLCFRGYCAADDGKQMVVVWNPSIRKSVGIQVPSDSYGEFGVIGFGVCPVTFDPTIIYYTRKMKDMTGVSAPWMVRVFTLRTGAWSILSTNLPRDSTEFGGSQVVIDRFIYWVAFDMFVADYGRSQSRFLIMSFDLTAKEFKEINLPGCLTNRRCSIQAISNLRESLVVLAYHRDFEEDVSVCCLWMMNEQGVNRSFTKLYNINLPHATVKTLFGFRKTGEIILETQPKYKGNTQLEVYDPNSEAIDNLGIHGYFYSLCSYMETLLLLDQLNGFIYTIGN